jgi:surface antigen
MSRLHAFLMIVSLVLMGFVGAATTASATVYGDDYPAQWRNVPQDSTFDSWGEYNRECTSFVAWRLSSRNGFTMPFHDNASGWKADAQARGYTVNSTPAVGAVAWDSGHVAWVAEVNGGNVTLEEYNYAYTGTYHTRVVASSAFQYIHFKDIVSTPPPAPAKTVNVDFNRDTTPDIYAFNRNEGGSTTVRVINGVNVHQWLLQDSTLLGQTGPETDFAVDDYNGDGIPDIYAIDRNDAGSNSTAVRIINGANRQQWLLQSGTLLGQTGPETSFAVADYNQDGVPDIYAFNRNESGATTVRIINGANLHQWLLQSPTVLGVTSDSTEFAVGFYNSDNVPDIYAIQRDDAGSGSTAVRIINGANVYQWLLQTGTILGQTSQAWDFRVADFNKDGKSDLYAIDRNDAGSNSTAVHIVNGDGFNSWLLQSGTLLGQTNTDWSFS